MYAVFRALTGAMGAAVLAPYLKQPRGQAGVCEMVLGRQRKLADVVARGLPAGQLIDDERRSSTSR